MNRIRELMKMEKAFGLKHIEVWVWVNSYEGLYKISNLGNVLNVKSGKVLKPRTLKIGYKAVNLYNNKKKITKYIHRLVAEAFLLNPLNKRCTDHINRCRTDNNLLNLRWSTHSENQMNKSMQKNNTSDVVGVSFHNKMNKWESYINVNGKRKHLGYFKEKAEAIEARKQAELKHYGEYRNKTT